MVKRNLKLTLVIFAILFILIIILGIFYWWQIRPYIIVKECNDFAHKLDRITEELGSGMNYNEAYQDCLRSKGINK